MPAEWRFHHPLIGSPWWRELEVTRTNFIAAPELSNIRNIFKKPGQSSRPNSKVASGSPGFNRWLSLPKMGHLQTHTVQPVLGHRRHSLHIGFKQIIIARALQVPQDTLGCCKKSQSSSFQKHKSPVNYRWSGETSTTSLSSEEELFTNNRYSKRNTTGMFRRLFAANKSSADSPSDAAQYPPWLHAHIAPGHRQSYAFFSGFCRLCHELNGELVWT